VFIRGFQPHRHGSVVRQPWNNRCFIESMALARTGILLLWLASVLVLPRAATGQTNAGSSPHYVFAHYMVCFPTYGETVAAYQREIREAQAAGIDGFALNVGDWSGPNWYYKTRVASIYNAAEQMGTGFKLFFSIELTNTADILDMVTTYAPRTNSFRYQGKVVLSTYGQNSVDWQHSVLAPLNAAGIGVSFVPFFWPASYAELPTYQDAVSILNMYSNTVNGLFLFGAAGLPEQLAQCNSNYTAAMHASGKISMAGFTPNYWGCYQYSNGRRYAETRGGEGTVVQWQSIIKNQPDWVEIVTWNDFNESTYVSPTYTWQATPTRYSHSGYLELSSHYITWYKTGQEPAIDRDGLFFFYRTHPKAAIASNTNDIPVTGLYGGVEDILYTTVFLLAPAQLMIVSGANQTTNSLPAGISAIRTPFAPGTQTMTLVRNGTQVFSVQGSNIVSQIQNYDFFPASGFAYSKPSPPLGFHLLGP
jgi:glycosyl hydrolase family 71